MAEVEQAQTEEETAEEESESESLCDYFDFGGKTRAIALVEDIFDAKEAQCSYLQGGAFNSVFQTVVRNQEFILRFPKQRLPVVQFYNVAATLNFVATNKLLRFPVPRVIAANDTPDNKLGRQYWLQTRMPGECLADVFQDLSVAQRCSLAEQVANCMADIYSVKFKHCGHLVASSNPHAQLAVVGSPQMVDNRSRSAAYAFSKHVRGQRKPRNLYDYLQTRFQALWERSLHPVWMYYWKIAQMYLPCRFPTVNCLVHPDLFKRNILVQIGNDDSLRISGVIDWDDCEALPPQLAYSIPGWLWNWTSNAGSRQLDDVDAPPSGPEGERVRAVFQRTIERRIPGYFAQVREFRRQPELQTLGWLAREGEKFIDGNCPSMFIGPGNLLIEKHNMLDALRAEIAQMPRMTQEEFLKRQDPKQFLESNPDQDELLRRRVQANIQQQFANVDNGHVSDAS